MPDIWMDVDTAVQVPVSLMPLVDRTDFITIEDAIAWNEAGMAVAWNFVTTAGVMTTTAITPTTGDDHDWLEEGTNQGMYSIEIPATLGDANNDTEGVGWITGETSSCLPFRGPTIGFRAAALNNALINGGDLLDVNLTKVADTAQTAGDLAALIVTADAAIDVTVADLANGTDGLGALKALIDTVNNDLANGTDGLGALKALIDTADTAIDVAVADLANGTDGLGALKTLIDTVNTDLANGTDGLGALKTLIDTVNSDLANGTDGLGALATLITAVDDFVDTEIAAILALLDDARAEPGQGAPPVNPDLATKIDYLYKWTRNKKDNDGSTTQFYADNGTTVDQKQTTSEAGGTVTKAEIATGP